ncbi:hypothetical protein ACFW6K_18545 [Streptomyces sp. NPDC058733]
MLHYSVEHVRGEFTLDAALMVLRDPWEFRSVAPPRTEGTT